MPVPTTRGGVAWRCAGGQPIKIGADPRSSGRSRLGPFRIETNLDDAPSVASARLSGTSLPAAAGAVAGPALSGAASRPQRGSAHLRTPSSPKFPLPAMGTPPPSGKFEDDDPLTWLEAPNRVRAARW